MSFDEWNLPRVSSIFAKAGRFVMNHRVAASFTLSALLLAGAILPLLGQQQKPAVREARKGENERDSALQIRKRAQWFFQQRAYPLGYIPADARVKALRQKAQMRQANGTFMGRFAASPSLAAEGSTKTFSNSPVAISSTTWTPLGPQPTSSDFFGFTSGRVNALAVDPCDATGNTVYAGGAEGGVWKTTDGGSTWAPMTDNQISISTGSLAVDPVAADCTGGAPSAGGHTGAIYYGTGEENFAYDSFYGAGVLISHDGGTTWVKDNTFVIEAGGIPPSITPQSSQFAGPFIGTISVDPATSGATQVLLAAVEGISAQSHSGIWRSTNGGASWTLDPPSSYSGDNGQYDNATSVAFDPNDSTGNTAFAALGVPFCTGSGGTCSSANPEGNNGVYKSTDNGMTWTRLAGLDTAAANAGLSKSNYGRITIAVGPSSPASSPSNTEVVVAIADITTSSKNLLGLFKSVDGGNTFAVVNTGTAPIFCNAQCFYDMTVSIDPSNANIILLGGGPAALGKNSNGGNNSVQCGQVPANSGVSDVLISTDGGTTWNDASCDNSSGAFIHVDTHAFAFDPNGAVYVGNDGGVWGSPSGGGSVLAGNGGQTWNDLNGTLNLTQFYPGSSISPSNPEIAFAGAQDNGTQQFNPAANGNPSNPQEWIDGAVCGDGGWTAIDPSTPSTVYAACEAIGQFGEMNKNQSDGFVGTGQFSNWIGLETPAMDADNANFVPPMVVDPSAPQNVYFGTSQVWQSTNGGISWASIFNTASGTGCASGCVLTAMDVAPNSSSTIYGGTDTGAIFVSTNATAPSPTFSEISTTSMPQRYVTAITASPMSSTTAFVGYSGFSSCFGCDGLGHLYVTTNGGQSWTNISGNNLPDTPVNDIVVDPNDLTNSTLYIATDVGVFITTDGGINWAELAPGLPQVECTSLKLNETARVLQVGTHGRGVWDLQLGGLPASALTQIFPTSTTVGTSVTLTLNGQGFPATPTVNFGTTPLTPTAASATQITVTVPTTALASSGVVPVSVSGGVQNSLNFSVEGPLPVLGNVVTSPGNSQTITAGTATNLLVTGSNFTANTELLWTPITQGLTQNGITTALAQNSNSLSCSGGNCQFTVTVPAGLSSISLTKTVPVTPVNRGPYGPGGYWLLAAFCAAILGLLLLINLPAKRRLVLGATLTTVFLLALIGGCSSSAPPNNGGPPPTSVTILTNAYNPAPGGGLSNNNVNLTDQ
ncbi:MAG TPA: hypothetical protein VGR81_14505 [Candidatus Acidoferrales bacterium]|nr:hypothetical protein [Candidatus Acidoferrales bacterium]